MLLYTVRITKTERILGTWGKRVGILTISADINRATGLPVFSIYSFVCWFQLALTPRAKF